MDDHFGRGRNIERLADPFPQRRDVLRGHVEQWSVTAAAARVVHQVSGVDFFRRVGQQVDVAGFLEAPQFLIANLSGLFALVRVVANFGFVGW